MDVLSLHSVIKILSSVLVELETVETEKHQL